MERLRNMGIKKSFFAISLLFLSVGILFGAAAFMLCMELQSSYFVGDQVVIDFDSGSLGAAMQPDTATADWRADVLSVLQIVLPMVCVISALLLAAAVFYHVKLKKPLADLQSAAGRIREEDLDFSLAKHGNDELGELSAAFEAMRAELLRNKRDLWRQMEERKRLNAAFSHDLRNPVTVLKGCAKMLQKSVDGGDLSAQGARDTVALIAQYAGRIEDYVEAMSAAQKLEDLKCEREQVDWLAFAGEMESGLSMLLADTEKEMIFSHSETGGHIWLDKSIVQNTAENLVGNALRYARSALSVALTLDDEYLEVRVADDGPGFSATILDRGAEPFLRDDNAAEPEHFGMGLYVCRLLCEKHGGGLTLQNTPNGACAVARFHIL